MIAKGTAHNNGARLAVYMTTGKDGERAELWQLRGFAAEAIKDAFRSVHVMAEATHCTQPFFHAQVRNPEGEELTRAQWERAADRLEAKLGYSGQPRAITFHIDEATGHEHMHVAWSRIDEDRMVAKPLPFFKLRLKETCRELEQELGLTPVRNERPGTVMAPARAEDEQARRLDVDLRATRQTIRECFDHADSGKAFAAALADHDLTLAQGERRDFLVIDAEGGLHALGKRILGVTAAQTRERLADLDREALPTVAEVRQHLAERVPEKIAERTQEPIPEPATARAADTRPATPQTTQEPTQEPTPEVSRRATPELGQTAGQIRLACSLAADPQAFAAALEDRGLILARVPDAGAGRAPSTPQQNSAAWMTQTGGADALDADHRESAQHSYDAWRLKNTCTFENYVSYVQKKWAREHPEASAPPRQEELVVVNRFGSVHRLTEHNTGLERAELATYLAGIDRAPLLAVDDARAVMAERQQQRLEEWKAAPDLEHAAEHLADVGATVAGGVGRILGGALRLAEAPIGFVIDFLTGGSGAPRAPAATAAPQQNRQQKPDKTPVRQAQATLRHGTPEMAARDPGTRSIAETYVEHLDEAQRAALRRQAEEIAARQRENWGERER